MPALPDSGDPGNLFQSMQLDEHKPDASILLTEATKQAIERTGYQLHGEISSGGYGAAFEARHTGTRAKAVIKVMLAPSNADHRKALQRECKILAADLAPSDLLPAFITAVDTPGIQPFVVMEFIAGKEIHEYVSQPTPMSMPRRIEIVEKLFRAYDRLHASKIAHGDPSSRNVLVESGDRIRLIDFGSACRLDPGYGSVGTVSFKGITPAFGDEDILINGKRPDRWTDLYAVAGIAFHVLTGKAPPDGGRADSPFNRDPQGSESADEQADSVKNASQRVAVKQFAQALRDTQVPAEVIRIIVKARTKRDDRIPPEQADPHVFASALDAADAIHNWREGKLRRAAFFKHSLITLALMAVVGVFGAIGWNNYWIAEAAADLKVWQSLQAEIRQLPELNNQAVNALRQTEKQLLAQRDDAIARNDQSTARQLLSDLLSNSREQLFVTREVERATKLREAIGKVLLEDEASEKAGFWIVQAPTIGTRLDDQKRRYSQLAQAIQRGEVTELREKLGLLLTDLGELFRVNIEARSTIEARVSYARLADSIPDRLTKESGYRAIEAGAQAAESSWSVAEWDQGRSLALARSQFGVTQQQLETFLKENENEAERAARVKDNQERDTQLEAERRKLLDDVARKAEDVRKLNEQVATLDQERRADAAKLKTAETERDAAKLKAKDADATKTALTKAETEREAAKKTLGEKETLLQELQPRLAEMDRWKSRAEKAEELLTALPASSSDSGESRKVIIEASKVASLIEARIKALDTKDRDAAIKERTASVTEWQKNAALLQAARDRKTELLKTNAPDGKEVVDQEQVITSLVAAGSRLEATVLHAQDKLDQADRQQYDEREAAKKQYAAIKKTLMEGELKRLANHPDVVQQDNNIAQQTREQAPYAAGAARAAGSGNKLTLDEVVKLSGVPPVVIAGIGGVSGARYTDKGGNNYIRIEPGEFLMGAPEGEAEASSDEKPQHRVRISQPFYFGEYEETQAEFQDVMGFNPSYFSASGGGADSVKGMDTSKFPIDSVCWYDNCEFANRKSQKNGLTPCYRISNAQKDGPHIKSADITFIPEGTGFRMPKEAEWEYVARAGTTTPFWFGSTNNGEKANVDGNYPYGTNTKGPYLARTTKVGSYGKNAFGIYDTVGNVWEPCQDVYDAKVYASRGNGVTIDPLVVNGSMHRVFRGGSVNYFYSGNSRSAYRDRNSPGYRYLFNGCRLVLSGSGVRTRNN